MSIKSFYNSKICNRSSAEQAFKEYNNKTKNHPELNKKDILSHLVDKHILSHCDDTFEETEQIYKLMDKFSRRHINVKDANPEKIISDLKNKWSKHKQIHHKDSCSDRFYLNMQAGAHENKAVALKAQRRGSVFAYVITGLAGLICLFTPAAGASPFLLGYTGGGLITTGVLGARSKEQKRVKNIDDILNNQLEEKN